MIHASRELSSRARRSGRAIFIAFAAVVAGFFAATITTQINAGQIHYAALQISENAAPSIDFLAASRAGLRNLEVILFNEVARLRSGTRPDWKQADDVRRSIQIELDAYFALPPFPRETERWPRLRKELAALDAAVARLEAAAERGPPDAAVRILSGEVQPAIDRTADIVLEMTKYDAQVAHDFALEIERIRRRSMLIAYGLDVLCGLLAILTAFLVRRAIGQYTDLLESHARLIEQRNEELDQFTSQVAHDVLSPLAAVGVALEVARRATSGEKTLALIARGAASLMRVKRIVEGLLAFARSARPERGARADVGEILEDVVGELRPNVQEARIELKVEPFPPRTVVCSDGVLTSLVSNLLRNAIKYIGPGSERRIVVRVFDRGPRVRVEVEDTGPGVPPEIRSHLFEPYVRASNTGQPGIGLGLATVKRMAIAHGGSVGMQPGPGGRGCVFWFELPQAPPLPAEPRPSPSATEPLPPPA